MMNQYQESSSSPNQNSRFEFTAQLLRRIANPTRLAILFHLNQQGPTSVNELSTRLQIDQSMLSTQLIRMKDHQLLIRERQGKRVYYSLADNRVAIMATMFGLL